MHNQKTVVNLLWTGGWDSTFRIIQLIEKNIIIQPYYLKDTANRKSEQQELKAMLSITKEIQGLKNALCTLNDLITMDVIDIETDTDISEAYNSLSKKTYLGSQYDWLARFAQKVNNLELMIHQDDKAFSAINNFGAIVKKRDDQKGEYYTVDTARSSEEVNKVFGRFHFPILNLSKLDMKKEAEDKGLIHIMHKTWFCHSPKNNQPCGECNPCVYTIEEGMGYRLNKTAIIRYKIKVFKDSIKNIFRKA